MSGDLQGSVLYPIHRCPVRDLRLDHLLGFIQSFVPVTVNGAGEININQPGFLQLGDLALESQSSTQAVANGLDYAAHVGMTHRCLWLGIMRLFLFQFIGIFPSILP